MFKIEQIIKGIFRIVFLFGVFFTFYYLLVGRLLPLPFNLILCLLGTIFMLISIGSFRNAMAKYKTLQLTKRSLASDGTYTFQDGEKIVVSGQIYPLDGQVILSPFSKERCVFYTYNIYYEKREDSDVAYSGFYLTPSYVNTSFGKIRILAFPALAGFKNKNYSYSSDTEWLYQNAYSYVRNTRFEECELMGTAKPGKAYPTVKDIFSGAVKAYRMVKDILTDDDGYLRNDTKDCAEVADLKTMHLEELYIKQGENVSLTGVWSTAKQGVIVDLSKSAVVITKGLSKGAIKVTKKEVFKKFAEGILIFLIINLIIGVFVWRLAYTEILKNGLLPWLWMR